MNLGDVFAIFGLLLVLGVALPGMLLTWALLFPRTVQRARVRLQQTPGRSFGLGVGLLLLAVPVLTVCFVVPLPIFRLVGWLGICMLLLLSSLGGAGLALLMGDRLRSAGLDAPQPVALLRGAIALELALFFPIIGWFVALPVALLCGLGAATFGLLRWSPRPTLAPQPGDVTQPAEVNRAAHPA